MVWEYVCTNLRHSFGVWKKGESVSVLLGILVAAVIAALPLIGLSFLADIDWSQRVGLGLALWFGVLVLVVTPYRLWKEQREEIEGLKTSNKDQAVLDEISALKAPLAALRIDMLTDAACNFGKPYWEKKYREMQESIAAKLREFTGNKTEANDFLTKGNLDRTLPVRTPHQLYIDMCVRDRAYSRGPR